MVLQFQPPPDWLIQGYLERRNQNPAVEAISGANQVMQAYAKDKLEEHKQKNEALQTLLKASDSVDLSDPATAKAFAPLYKDAGVDPSIFNPPTASTGTIPSPQSSPMAVTPVEQASQQSMPAQHPAGVPDAMSGISPIVQASLAAGHPDHSGIMSSVGDPNQLIKTGFGRKKLAAAESAQKLTDAQTTAADKASEQGPKSFDYARVFATNAGAPQGAEGFIKLAQQEGRTTLTKREMDDMKNSLSASAQTGRGEYFAGMLGINRGKFQNQLLQEGNKALNPNVAGGALKPQQERLNRIGRADALVQQMKTQVGGGDTRQMRELATSLASVLTGGNVVAEQQINELVPQSYKGNLNKFYEKLSNNPTGLEQQAFIARLADTLAREKGTINTQVQGAQTQALPGLAVLKQTNPKGYQGIVDANVNNPAYQNPAPQGQAQTPQVGQVYKGHVFLGGDPSQPTSWRAQ